MRNQYSPHHPYVKEHKRATMDPLKYHIPPFSRARDVETYLDWEMKGSKSIKEYHKDMELDLSRANVLESNEATMARFLHGLNQDIQDMIEMSHYSTMDDLGKQKEKERPGREKIPKKESTLLPSQKEEGKLPNLVQTSKSSSIKCSKYLGKGHIALNYPNKRSMIMKKDGIVDSASSNFESSSKSESDASYELSLDQEGDLLVVSLALVVGQYKDKVLYNIVTIEAAYILLGRSLQYDHKVIHDRVTNKFTFVHRGQKVILKPLSPKKVNIDQDKMM
ncbi:hypothetical protein CR513_12979, partial [Mucuna pruriens]